MKTLKHALRVLVNLKTYTLINIAGLVVSLTGVIIIARYLDQELTVDHYIPELDRTYALFNDNSFTEAVNWNEREGFPVVDQDEALECFTRFTCIPSLVIHADGLSAKARGIAIDSMFLDLLPRRVVMGQGILKEANNAIVTQKLAERLWPGEMPIGKTLTIGETDIPLNIVGVVEEAATKCNLDYDVLIRSDLERWMFVGWFVCRLKPGYDYHDYNARQKPYTEVYTFDDSTRYHFQLRPFGSIYFDRTIHRSTEYPFLLLGNMQNVRILMLVAILLLTVGLFNFLNIYSVVMVYRRRNFAIRKTFGEGWKNILALVFAENAILTGTAVAIAWIVALLASSMLERVYGITQQSSVSFDLCLTAAIALAFPLIVSIIATISIWNKAKVHSMDNADSAHAIRLRRWFLLLPQMAIAVFLIVVSGYFMRQLSFMLNADLGFRTHDIASVLLFDDAIDMRIDNVSRIEQQASCRERLTMAMDKIRKSSLFEHSAVIDWDAKPGFFTRYDQQPYIKISKAHDNNAKMHDADYLWTTRDIFNLYEFEVIEGRMWDMELDTGFAYKCIITESTKQLLGINDITQDKIQLDHRIWFNADEDCTKNPPFEIVGVIKDFHRRHMAASDIPTILLYKYEQFNHGKPLVSFRHENRDRALAFLSDLYAEINDGANTQTHMDAASGNMEATGNGPLFNFIEDDIARLYADDTRTALIYTTFAFLAIAVSMLGLFGVVVYDMQRRSRELRIRKVYGARRSDIFLLIMRPYAIAIAAASTIAAPASIAIIRHYQEGCHNHVPFTAWHFLLAVACVMLVASLGVWGEVRRTWSRQR